MPGRANRRERDQENPMQGGFGQGGQPPGYPPGAGGPADPFGGPKAGTQFQPPSFDQLAQPGQPAAALPGTVYQPPAQQPVAPGTVFQPPAQQPGNPATAYQPPAAPMMPGALAFAGASPAGPYAPAGGGYEFSEAENQVVSRLAGRLTAAGIMQIVFGVISLFGNLLFGVGAFVVGIPGSVAMIVIGAIVISAAGSFRSIASTQGSDIRHLMSACEKLSSAALVQIIGYIAAVVLGALIAVIGLLFFAALFAAAAGR
jgi:hypothetical protein